MSYVKLNRKIENLKNLCDEKLNNILDKRILDKKSSVTEDVVVVVFDLSALYDDTSFGYLPFLTPIYDKYDKDDNIENDELLGFILKMGKKFFSSDLYIDKKVANIEDASLEIIGFTENLKREVLDISEKLQIAMNKIQLKEGKKFDKIQNKKYDLLDKVKEWADKITPLISTILMKEIDKLSLRNPMIEEIIIKNTANKTLTYFLTLLGEIDTLIVSMKKGPLPTLKIIITTIIHNLEYPPLFDQIYKFEYKEPYSEKQISKILKSTIVNDLNIVVKEVLDSETESNNLKTSKTKNKKPIKEKN